MPVPPVKNEAFTFYVTLTSQADTDVFQTNPTLAAGDVLVSIDGGALNPLVPLPTVSPAGGEQVEVVMTAANMNGDVMGVLFSDAAGNEWQDLYIEIFTDTQQIGDIPTAAAITAAVWAAATRTLTSYGTLVADTATAVWAYATRTLSSFGTLVADVWGYATRTLTQTAAQVAAAVSGSDITLNSYNTWTIALTGVGDISSRTALYFTAKRNPEEDVDPASIVQVEETAGLLYIGGASPIAAGNGSITVTDATAGNLTIVVAAAETGLTAQGGQYSVKMVTDSTVEYMASGSFQVEAEAGRAIA